MEAFGELETLALEYELGNQVGEQAIGNWETMRFRCPGGILDVVSR